MKKLLLHIVEKIQIDRFGSKILAELSPAGGETYVPRPVNVLILFGIRKNCLSNRRSVLLYQFTKRAIKLIILVVIIKAYYCYQLHTKFYPTSSLGD
jgi:hypothetical protein